MKRLMAIAMMLALVVVFGAPNAAQAGATVTVFPFVDFHVLCNGESVFLVGSLQETLNIHEDNGGGFHIVSNWNIKAHGTGDLGNEYKLNWSDNFHVYDGGGPFANGDPLTITNAFNHNLVSKGKAPNLDIRGVFNTTINANGTVTVDFLKFVVTCK